MVCRKRPQETKKTVEMGDACKWETKDTMETNGIHKNVIYVERPNETRDCREYWR